MIICGIHRFLKKLYKYLQIFLRHLEIYIFHIIFKNVKEINFLWKKVIALFVNIWNLKKNMLITYTYLKVV